MKYLLSLITCLSLCNYAATATTIHGKIEPNTIITIYQYTDYIVYNKKEIAETTTDKDGVFSINISIGRLNRIQVNINDELLRFYASDDINYTISKENSKYSINTDDGAEDINSTIKYAYADWNALRRIWIKDRRPSAIEYPERILNKLDTIRRDLVKTDRYKIEYDYKFASMGIYYTVFSYHKSDSAEAFRRFDKLITDFIETKPVAINNPFYIGFLDNYIDKRMTATKFRRLKVREPLFDKVIREYNSFSNDSLKELILVLGVKRLYSSKWYEGLMLETFNTRIDSLKETMKLPIFKSYLDLVMKEYNKVKVGSTFPTVSLIDDKGELYSIDKIKTPYILVDFWATWCGPCKRNMAKFPALVDKYGDSLTIVTISADAEWQTMVDYLNSKNYTSKWIALHNGEKGKYFDKVPISVYPTYYLLDADKKVIDIPKSGKLVETIDKLMKD